MGYVNSASHYTASGGYAYSVGTTGNLLVVIASGQSTASFTISDTGGNSWTEYPSSSVFSAGSTTYAAIFYCYAKASGSTTITCAGGGDFGWIISEYSGYPGGLDVENNALGNISVSKLTTNANDLLIGMYADENNGASSFGGSGTWNTRQNASSHSAALCDQTVSSTGTYTFTATGASGTDTISVILAFKASGGSATVVYKKCFAVSGIGTGIGKKHTVGDN